MPESKDASRPLEEQKVSTGILLNRIKSDEQRAMARELHESLLDLRSIWAPSEVFEHESIAYRLKGRAFVHMAPPLCTDGIEVHVLEGTYALPSLVEMASGLPDSANLTVHDHAQHRHTKGGEMVIHVRPDNFAEAYRFLLRLYHRARGA